MPLMLMSSIGDELPAGLMSLTSRAPIKTNR
jgi:hypothetical protein